MDKTWLDSLRIALGKAKEERDRACYLEEYGGNQGIKKINANKASWLTHVIYLAELGFECEKRLGEVEATADENISDFKRAMDLFKSINN